MDLKTAIVSNNIAQNHQTSRTEIHEKEATTMRDASFFIYTIF